MSADGIQIMVGPGKAVEVVIPNIAIEDLIAIVDGYFMPPAAQGRLASVLQDSPALTLTLTSKVTPPTARFDLIKAAHAASHALKSYQHGNAAPDLARECAAALDAAIAAEARP